MDCISLTFFSNIVATLALEHVGAASVSLPDVEFVEAWPLAGILTDDATSNSRFTVERIDLDWLQGEGLYRATKRA